jgi:formylglycine-generating enzyme
VRWLLPLLALAPAAGFACNAIAGIEKLDYLPGSADAGAGAGGVAGGSGSAGASGGAGGSGGIAALGEPCDEPARLACAGHAQKVVLICDGKWTAFQSCSGKQLCDTGDGPNRGSCQDPVPECIGKDPGDRFCDDRDAVACGPDLLTSIRTACDYGCADGACAGSCESGSGRCSGPLPELCSPEGDWQPAGADCPFLCADGQCTGECQPLARRCNGSYAEECDDSGRWGATPCPKLCQQGFCVSSCSEGTKQCSAGVVPQTCTGGEWVDDPACPYYCEAGQCMGECFPGAARCTGLVPESCDASGKWQAGAACAYFCQGGVCTGVCRPGDKRCGGLVAESCDASGRWQSLETCTYVCADGACTGACTPGEKKCSGPVPETCDASGQWTAGTACASVCTAGECSGSCAPNSKQCNGLLPQTCDTSGKWVDGATCPYVCSGGVCTGVCTPGSKRCNNPQPQSCDANGAWQNSGGACLYVCTAGACTGVCSPGSKQCAGSTPQTCQADGTWKNETACSGTNVCSGGACVTAQVSCQGLVNNCGPTSNESCCSSPPVTGGTFNRSNDPTYPATVSDFRLDRFEITVGRFRKFVAAYPGSKPAAGGGAHPLLADSGWQSAWDAQLPAGQAALIANVKCGPNQTWTDAPGANETKPMNCINWYETFAFCVWDGGRLPTEAEWNYAAAGGSEQRNYPWGTPIDCTYANYMDCGGAALPVGSKSPKGDGKWGHADLAGNVWEWNLDWYDTYPNPCNNCANLIATNARAARGGSYVNTQSQLVTWDRLYRFPWPRHEWWGARCARTP